MNGDNQKVDSKDGDAGKSLPSADALWESLGKYSLEEVAERHGVEPRVIVDVIARQLRDEARERYGLRQWLQEEWSNLLLALLLLVLVASIFWRVHLDPTRHSVVAAAALHPFEVVRDTDVKEVPTAPRSGQLNSVNEATNHYTLSAVEAGSPLLERQLGPHLSDAQIAELSLRKIVVVRLSESSIVDSSPVNRISLLLVPDKPTTSGTNQPANSVLLDDVLLLHLQRTDGAASAVIALTESGLEAARSVLGRSEAQMVLSPVDSKPSGGTERVTER